MTHLPFIAAAYVVAIGVPVILAVGAVLRVRTARRRLDSIDPRRASGGV